MKKIINKENFFISSIATFTQCKEIKRNPDFISGEGAAASYYFYEGEYLVRKSAHWGKVAKCTWQLKDKIENTEECVFNGSKEDPIFISGKVKFSEMSWDEIPQKEDALASLNKFKKWEKTYRFNPEKPWITLPWIKNKINFLQSIINLIEENLI